MAILTVGPCNGCSGHLLIHYQHMKRTISAMAILFVVLAGCQKEQGGEKPKTGADAEVQGHQTIATNSLESSRDSVGKLHNEVLEALWNHVQNSGDDTAEGKRRFVIAYFKQHKSINIGPVLQKGMAFIRNNEPPPISEVMAQLKISEPAKDMLMAIDAALHECRDMGNENELAQRIRQAEEEATILDLPQEEQLMIRQAGAVAEYSSAFWKKIVGQYPLPAKDQPLLKWLAGRHADFIGALIGIACGDIAGESSYLSGLMTFYAGSYL